MELSHRLEELERENKLVEKQRLEERTKYDLDMLQRILFRYRKLLASFVRTCSREQPPPCWNIFPRIG